MNRASMRDIKGLYVKVEGIDPDIEKDGLTSKQIKADVRSQLQKAGLNVLSKIEWFDVSGNPYFNVNVNVLKLSNTGEYVYSVNVSLKQTVYPVREPVEVLGATTWSTGGSIGITYKLNSIHAEIREQVKKFITAYLDVNPK